MKKKLLIIGFSLVLTVVGVVIFRSKKSDVLTLNTATVTTGNIMNTVTATGTVEPIDEIDVGTQVSGVIDKIYVDYNDAVKKGQLLAELDRSTLKAQVLQSKASLSSAENELNYRRQNFSRTEKLYRDSLVSDVEFEEVQYQYNNASANVDQLKSKLEQAEVNLSYAYIYSPIDGVILNKSVEEGQTVAASFSTPTLFSIARDLTKMQVEADVDEADIGQVKVGQPVKFTVDAFPNDTFSGNVTQIRLQPTTTSNVVTYTVIIEAPNKELKLMPGLTASIEIIILEAKNTLLVVPKALQFEPTQELAEIFTIQQFPEPPGKNGNNGPHGMPPPMSGGDISANHQPQGEFDSKSENVKVVWIKKGNTIEPRFVETGLEDGARIEVLSGLSLGDSVIIGASKVKRTNGTQQSQSGSPFMPKPPQGNKTKKTS
ncbi:MAG: efflux RND transporter periplasmic adaptor subunit [Bacteroidales bacterium]